MSMQRFRIPLYFHTYLVKPHPQNQLVPTSFSSARGEVKVGGSRRGPPQHSPNEVVRSEAIRNGPGASVEDQACLWSTKTFRSWSSYTGFFFANGSCPS